jgi:hypothetical protein
MRLRAIVAAVFVAVAVFAAENLAVLALFPHLVRVTTDFSASYLERELRADAAGPARTVFLGDSVLWGYRLPPEDAAPALLSARGCACANLAFKSASPANYYGIARLLVAGRVHPSAVVIEINQQVFNPANSSYQTLHPAVAALAWPYFGPAERVLLGSSAGPPAGARWNEAVAAFVPLYGMRADLRETLYGDAGAAPVPTVLEGLYDLSPLDGKNIGVRFLTRTLAALRAARIPVLAFLTPTNHALMHEFIDVPEYRANLAYVRRLCERGGARVLDLDAAFPATLFFDNDHLTAAGQQRLAAVLADALARRTPPRP